VWAAGGRCRTLLRTAIPTIEEPHMSAAPTPVPTGTAPAPPARRRDLGTGVFRAAALLVVALLLAGPGGIRDLTAPLTMAFARLPGAEGELHRWHTIDVAAFVGVLVVGAVLVAAWRPRRSVTALQVVLASMVAFLLIATTMPNAAEILGPVAVVLVVLVAAHPRRRDLLRLPDLRSRSGLALLAAATATPFLLVNLAGNLGKQLSSTDPHGLAGHWGGAAALAATLLITVWVAASRADGARALSVLFALAAAYVGLSALVHDRYDGVWPVWGALSVLVAAAALLASLRGPQPSPTAPVRG
jgi:hypothetical protein